MGAPAVSVFLFCCLRRYQRSQIPAEQVILPDEVETMDVDPLTPPDAIEEDFRQRVLTAEKIFLEFRDGPSFSRRFNREVMQKLCEDRELGTGGHKKELYARLVAWVRRFVFVLIRIRLSQV